MPYSDSDFEADLTATARAMDAAYTRAKRIITRWFSGVNADFPAATYPDIAGIMYTIQTYVQEMEASGNAHLNNVLKFSDLTLPRE